MLRINLMMNMKWLNMKLSMREWCGWEGETVSVSFGQCSLVLWWRVEVSSLYTCSVELSRAQ